MHRKVLFLHDTTYHHQLPNHFYDDDDGYQSTELNFYLAATNLNNNSRIDQKQDHSSPEINSPTSWKTKIIGIDVEDFIDLSFQFYCR
jgi:hypothetical protein